jgi:nucleoside-diphosphate-sugar epimerase
MSTFGVYGNNYTCELTEDLPVNPQEPYSETKAFSEEITYNFNRKNFITTSIRLAMVFGWSPQMRFDFLVNTLIKNAVENKEINILGGKQIRPQIHISDVSKILIKLIQEKKEKISGEIYNLGSINKSVEDISAEINSSLEYKIDLVIKPPRKKENSFVFKL